MLLFDALSLNKVRDMILSLPKKKKKAKLFSYSTISRFSFKKNTKNKKQKQLSFFKTFFIR